MRDELFQYFVEIGHELNYQNAYALSSTRIDLFYTAFLSLASAGGIVTLSLWDKVPIIWAGIAFLAQVLQVLKPLMPFAKRRDALRFLRQDTQALFNDLWFFWSTVGMYAETEETNKQIATQMSAFKARQKASMERFASGIEFPEKKRLVKKAEKANQTYFWYHYDVSPEEVKK